MKNGADKHLTKGIAWFMVFWLGIGWQWQAYFPMQPAYATGEHMYILWDLANGSVPTGWTNDASYNGRYLRGDTVANATSTQDYGTHTHAQGGIAFQTASTPTSSSNDGKTGSDATDPHTHSISTFSIDAGTVDPAYKYLALIYCTAGITCDIPQNGIVMFASAAAVTGFTDYTGANGKLIRVHSSTEGTGGDDQHQHTNLSITSGSPTGTKTTKSGTNSASTITHTHTYSSTSPLSGSDSPPHTNVVLKTADSDIAWPRNMITMFDGDPNIDSASWNIISDSGGEAFYQVYVGANSSYATGQGSATHTHTLSVSSSTDTPSGLTANGGNTSLDGHSHTISGDLGTASNNVSYVDMVFAQYDPPDLSWSVIGNEIAVYAASDLTWDGGTCT